MKPLFLLIAVFSLPTWAQNCAQIDEKLTIHYQKMQNAGSYSDHFDDEVLERETFYGNFAIFKSTRELAM